LFATIFYFENSTQAARRGRQYQFAAQKKNGGLYLTSRTWGRIFLLYDCQATSINAW